MELTHKALCSNKTVNQYLMWINKTGGGGTARLLAGSYVRSAGSW